MRGETLVLIYNVLKLLCFILLAMHLGLSWWLLALVVVAVEVTYTPRI